MKKHSKNFERDYNWYLEHRRSFNFDGDLSTIDKVKYDCADFYNGVSAKEAFYIFDSTGKIVNTNEPELLFEIFKCKGGINFNIKMWAEDRAKGLLPKEIFEDIIEEFNLLPWMIEAVEKQANKYRKHI